MARRLLGASVALLAGTIVVVLSQLPGGRSDDAEIMLHTQAWAWGYRLRNPALFEWLAQAVMSMTGPSTSAVIALRLSCVALSWAVLFRLGRRWGLSPVVALAAALTPVWVPQFSYYVLFDLTHTVLAGVFYGLVVMAVHHALERPHWPRMALLGLVVGAGLQTKHFFALFVLGALMACAWRPPYRVLLQPRRLAVAVLVALAVAAPYALWALGQSSQAWDHQQRESLHVLPQASDAGWMGLWRVMQMVVVVTLPWWLIGALLGWRARRKAAALDDVEAAQPVPEPARWLCATLAATLVLVTVVWLALGARRFEAHHLYFMILAPLAAVLAGQARWRAERTWRVLAIASVAWFVALLGVFVIDNQRTARHCRWCGPYIDYAAMAATLKQVGFHEGTLYFGSHTRDLAVPSLRPHLPVALVKVDVPATESRVASMTALPCAVLWQPGRDDWLANPQALARLPAPLAAGLTAGQTTLRWRPPLVIGSRLGQELALLVRYDGCS